MSRSISLVILRASVLTGVAAAALLAGCSQEAQTPAAATVASSGTVEDREQQLKQREAELAQREADVAAKEREQALADREAEVAAQEQEVARQKQELEAAAAKKAAAKPAAKPASRPKPPASSTSPTRVASAEPKALTPPPPERIEVPSGTVLTLALADELTSKTAQPGDTLVATVASNLMVNGKVAVPIGTRVTGTVTDVISGSRSIGAIPTIGVRFNQIELEGGRPFPSRAIWWRKERASAARTPRRFSAVSRRAPCSDIRSRRTIAAR